jgi:hypothetical protein
MSTPSDFALRQQAFFTRLGLLDDRYKDFLALHQVQSLKECFETVFTHNSFGLPCFRLRTKAGLPVPVEIRGSAQALFKECLGMYAL